jgi:hypothetical protein
MNDARRVLQWGAAGGIVLLAILRYEMLGGFRAFHAIVAAGFLGWYVIFQTDLLVGRPDPETRKPSPRRRRRKNQSARPRRRRRKHLR